MRNLVPVVILAALLAATLLLFFRAPEASPEPASVVGAAVEVAQPAQGGLSQLYVQKVDGLHVTGIPIRVNIEEYRLRVTGAVATPVEFTFDQVRSMESETVFIVLECPGTFVDQGNWTGVPVTDILDEAGLLGDANVAEFVSIDGSYSSRVPLEELNDSYLIAYLFEGREFPEVHGYPLRLAAEGRPGNVWVKWLGEIRVLPGED